ncbi:DUF2834 domain-containing protein [Fischerella sp. PCC 9605]|uniref:DUF2834 domain-containing protein n=1 Tax=Fischerella sp. PCC 9605 TaxID=1173024 RepID=UPI0004B56495|nr:DUF2834 domain-containing protein [Fischerella sp. PCC 9605]
MLQGIYLLLCILGFALPYSPLVMFLLDHGFDIKLFFELMFANHICASFGLDVIVSGLVLLVFVFWEGTRLGCVFKVSVLSCCRRSLPVGYEATA